MRPMYLELRGADRARYFAPTAICGYLALLCVALIAISPFLTGLRDAIALTAAGSFGLLLAGGLGVLFWRAQWRDLEFSSVATAADADRNYASVREAILAAGWTLAGERPSEELKAVTGASPFAAGERVEVRFEGREVRVASICDPGTGFSLVGRQRCREHRERVLAAVGSATLP